MKKIYIVTSGIYSDYTIHAVFSTPELAAEYCKLKGSVYNIEEYDVDGEELSKSVTLWSVCLNFDTAELISSEGNMNEVVYHKDSFWIGNGFNGNRYITFIFDCDNAERGMKVASERLMIIKANPMFYAQGIKSGRQVSFYTGDYIP